MRYTTDMLDKIQNAKQTLFMGTKDQNDTIVFYRHEDCVTLYGFGDITGIDKSILAEFPGVSRYVQFDGEISTVQEVRAFLARCAAEKSSNWVAEHIERMNPHVNPVVQVRFNGKALGVVINERLSRKDVVPKEFKQVYFAKPTMLRLWNVLTGEVTLCREESDFYTKHLWDEKGQTSLVGMFEGWMSKYDARLVVSERAFFINGSTIVSRPDGIHQHTGATGVPADVV